MAPLFYCLLCRSKQILANFQESACFQLRYIVSLTKIKLINRRGYAKKDEWTAI